MATLAATHEKPLASDPNFPSGYTYNNSLFGGSYQTFDFTKNLYYAAIYGSPNGGIVETDLTTLHVAKSATLNQMYAGTAFGSPAGTPWSQDIWDLVCGNGTDLYLQIGTDYVTTHFTRVNPATMKVTGEWYGVTGHNGAVNRTATHTIVAYAPAGGSGLGPLLLDGTGMAPIGRTTTPTFSAYQTLIYPGATRSDGGCEFVMVNYDAAGGSGNIDLWRVVVSDSLALSSTKTGTLNILPLFSPGTTLNIGQVNYDAAHNAVILWMTNSAAPNGPPVWIVSANFDGSIRWAQGPLADVAMLANNRGQSQLIGTTLMTGSTDTLKVFDTGTGTITFSGSVPGNMPNYYFQTWDAERMSYWTYALGSYGFTRIDLVGYVPPLPPASLALDDVQVTTQPVDRSCQVFLEWSDDRGHSWSNPVGQTMGTAGEYRTSVQFQRLGMARDRVHRLTWSCATPTALQGAWIVVDASAKT